MKIISDSEFANFLTKKPLYSKVLATSDFQRSSPNYSSPLDFVNKILNLKCPNEKVFQTFKTGINNYEEVLQQRKEQGLHGISNTLPLNFEKDTKKLNLTFHLIGRCQSCGAEIDFLIRVYSDKSLDEIKDGMNIFICKIGQFPPYEISPDKIVEKYLLKEDIDNYKKALANLSISYGIGAFAYFRRIIEHGIIGIIHDISLMDFEGVDKIKEALKSFKKDHQMANLISIINEYLPSSLNGLGDNPIRLLYEQLSGGIHDFSEEECLKKAEMIDKILTYVIKKVNEEKFQINDVKDAMKQLRNNC